ncbi:PH domain-containing protein [Olivibacter domesticus]|uniref:PH domain-containing protein n=1 Tax=Olivibacter domesticus TaxID=407022 RepID=A0A1H7XBB5_OLID1|nr:PH domain-containing protein [Olivibacter domesticus]SEM30914.1 PH domain-containing protein [Olivibacter domesticus]
MYIEQYLNEEQDPKVVEKLVGKLKDMLTSGEAITYIAVQKKPAVTLFPDCLVITNKRIFLCEATKLGLTTNFEIFTWQDIKDVSFKEEFFGAKFTVIPQSGENLTVEYIPKVQARKLYQLASEALEKKQEELRLRDLELKKASTPPVMLKPLHDERHIDERPLKPEEEPILKPSSEPEDEVTVKLKKLKILFEKQLITQSEYENKKNEILSQL